MIEEGDQSLLFEHSVAREQIGFGGCTFTTATNTVEH